MQLKLQKVVASPKDSIEKITWICWSPNNLRMAAVTTNRVVYLYDEKGEQREKFTTKPADSKVLFCKNYHLKM
jgi:intraflagellar transport protein 172